VTARLTLSPQEAADTLGVSRDYFDEHVKPELRVVRRGRLVLVPLHELERWVERSAALTVGEERARCRVTAVAKETPAKARARASRAPRPTGPAEREVL